MSEKATVKEVEMIESKKTLDVAAGPRAPVHASMDDSDELTALGYTAELSRNRNMWTLLFQTLAMSAIPFGEGSTLIVGVYGGGPRAIFLGWIMVCFLNLCVAISLGELASRWPTSAGPYYWCYQITNRGRTSLSFLTGTTWLIGNWTIALSVNFGFAVLVAGTVGMFKPEWTASSWQLLLIFFAITLTTFAICTFLNPWLPMLDTIAAGWVLGLIGIIMVSLTSTAHEGRHSVSFALWHYEDSFSGWGNFTFFIGLLPAAYTLSGIGLIISMSEECRDPAKRVPMALTWCVPVTGVAGCFFILPILFTLPPMADVIGAPAGQALPFILNRVLSSPGGGLAIIVLVLILTIMCSVSITVAASRTTWAFARDKGLPFGSILSVVHPKLGVPVYSLALVTAVQLLLGLINMGSSSAFTAFVSVGVIGLSVSYGLPILASLAHGRKEVSNARWHCSPVIGFSLNIISVVWIGFETVLFSMPTVLPVTEVSMNYASTVFVGFLALSGLYYAFRARKRYTGPPASDGI